MTLQDINEVLNTGVMILIFFILGMIFVRLSKVFEIVETLSHEMNEYFTDFIVFKRYTKDSLVHIRYDLAEIKTRTKIEDSKDAGMNNVTTIEAFWLLANCLGMDNLLKHAENYTVKPIEDGAGDTAVFDKEGEIVDDRGELFWALAHLICHIVPNAEIRGIYQTRYDESGKEYYY